MVLLRLVDHEVTLRAESEAEGGAVRELSGGV